jgi:hypothetical protein
MGFITFKDAYGGVYTISATEIVLVDESESKAHHKGFSYVVDYDKDACRTPICEDTMYGVRIVVDLSSYYPISKEEYERLFKLLSDTSLPRYYTLDK